MIAPLFYEYIVKKRIIKKKNLCSATVGWLKTKDAEGAIKHVFIIRKATMSQKYFSHHVTSPLTE